MIAKVADTGVGMTEKIRQNIFDPFFTTKGARGMGLGMSVVYGIVTRHGGKIDVETALGRGTTFLLEFPMTRERQVPVSGTDGASLPQLVGGRDASSSWTTSPRGGGREGRSGDGRTRGRHGDLRTEALKMLELTAYDLVFTDLGMPDMSGWEVAEKINQDKPGLAVVLVTGWGTSLDEADVSKRGISAVVQKPFEIDELLKIAHGVLSKSLAAVSN